MTEEKSLDDFLNLEDYKKINNIQKIKKNLMACMDMKLFIKKAVEIIDNSEDFEFRSTRSKKFISEREPIFILKCNHKDLDVDYNKLNLVQTNELTSKITKLLDLEIVRKISGYMTECIIDKNKYDNLFKEFPEGLDDILLTNIYIVRLSIKDNSIVLKYFI